MKIAIFLSSFFCFVQTISSQDIINLKDGNEIYCKVEKITDEVVEYRKYSNLQGPLYTKNKSLMASIKFENGYLEVFNSKGSEPEVKNESKKEYRIIKPPENDGVGIAEVIQLNAIDIYFMNKPLLEYEIVFNSGDFLSDVDIKSIFWGGLSRHHVKDKMVKLVNAAYRKSYESGEMINGVVYTGGNRAIAIRYTGDSIPELRLAKVDVYKEKEIYVLSKPYEREYEEKKKKAAKSGSFTSFISLGIVSSSMDEDIKEMIRSFNPKWHDIDGVLYDEGRHGVGIKFK